MRNEQIKILNLDDRGVGEDTTKNKNELSKDKLRKKFLQRAVKKHESLLTRLSRT